MRVTTLGWPQTARKTINNDNNFSFLQALNNRLSRSKPDFIV